MNSRNFCLSASGLSLALTTLIAPAFRAEAQFVTWADYEVTRTGWALTEENFLGQVQVGRTATDKWVMADAMNSHYFILPEYVHHTGAWAYAPYLGAERYNFRWSDQGWLHVPSAATWAFAAQETLQEQRGWIYVLNASTAIPPPEMYFLTSAFTADEALNDIDPPGYTNARQLAEGDLDRFANALHLGPEDIAKYVQYDADVTMTTGPEGLTFISTAPTGNRFVKLFHHKVEGGTIDFSELNDYTGKAGFVVHAAVDLSASSGGFYCNLKNDGTVEYVDPRNPDNTQQVILQTTDAATYSRMSAGMVDDDVLLENHANEWTGETYFELTLPPQGSVTIKDIYMYLATEIRGFANLEERITGGAGATPENTHTVTNVNEMITAIDAVRNLGEPAIIYIDGTLAVADWEAIGGSDTRQFSIGQEITNLSIIGVEDRGLFDGLGFKVHGANILFKNLTVRYLWMRNAFEINDARFIHVTQCTMYGIAAGTEELRFDEFMSVKNQARYVVVSWNHMHTDPHGRGMLIGSNGGVESLPDRKVIMHHNWFQEVGSRHPLVRGGYTHVYNNFFDNVNWGANIRARARSRIENNFIVNASRAIFLGEEPPAVAGRWEVSGNIFVGGDPRYQPTESTVTLNFEDAYTYDLDPAADIPDIVRARAGAGRTVPQD